MINSSVFTQGVTHLTHDVKCGMRCEINPFIQCNIKNQTVSNIAQRNCKVTVCFYNNDDNNKVYL